MKRIIITICFVSLCAAAGFPEADIRCSIPAGPFYTIPYEPYPFDLERILNLVFQGQPTSMRYVHQHTIFRQFYNYGESRMVEAGFPGYIGVRYEYAGVADKVYFLSQIAALFGITNFTAEDIVELQYDGAVVYRTKPVSIGGVEALFDDTHAGEGCEMSVRQNGDSKEVFIKVFWHTVRVSEATPLSVDIAAILDGAEELDGKKITRITPVYLLTSDSVYQPVISVETRDGGAYYYRLDNGETANQFRTITGR